MVSHKVISVMWMHNFIGIYQAFGDVRNLFRLRVLSDLMNNVVYKHVFARDCFINQCSVFYRTLNSIEVSSSDEP
jgi:hypothetical protein